MDIILSVKTLRYDTRIDYIFCGQDVRSRWRAIRAWHSRKKINEDHHAVFVVFNRHSCLEDPTYCIEHHKPQQQQQQQQPQQEEPHPSQGPPAHFGDPASQMCSPNIARIANAVQCHSYLSGTKDCHEFRFSIVRIVISASTVKSLYGR